MEFTDDSSDENPPPPPPMPPQAPAPMFFDLKPVRQDVLKKLSSEKPDWITFFWYYPENEIDTISTQVDLAKELSVFKKTNCKITVFHRIVKMKADMFYNMKIYSIKDDEPAGSNDVLGLALGVSCGDAAYFVFSKIDATEFESSKASGIGVKDYTAESDPLEAPAPPKATARRSKPLPTKPKA